MLKLEKEINCSLQECFNNSKDNGREYLSKKVISKVESIIDNLNNHQYNLGCCSYGGDIDYENSEQWYSNGDKMGFGLIIQFMGFTAKVSWGNE